MLSIFLTALGSFLITFFAIPAIIKVAVQKKLFDIPDARKLHTRPIASLGGIAIFIGLFLPLLLSVSGKENPEFQYFFASSIVIFFLGLKDDILILSATKKFLGQLGAAAIIIHLGHVRIESMHGLFGIHQLPELISMSLTYITVIVIINAFNLIDGVDGLAGSLGLVTMLVFGMFFQVAGLSSYSLLAFAMAGSLLAFLFYNFNPAKIFMGDSGSLLLGLINAILVIKFINIADSNALRFPIHSSVAIGFSILIVPLLDTLRVFSIRISQGRSPFTPDKNHIHHLLLERGLNQKQVTLSCVGLNLSFIAMAWFGRSIGSTLLLSIMICTSYTMIASLIFLIKPKSAIVITKSFQPSESILPGGRKILTIKNEISPAEAMVEQ